MINAPALAASQIAAISAEITKRGAYPAPVFQLPQGGTINEIAAFKRGQWYGSVAANPDGPGLIALDETGKILAQSQSPTVMVAAALGAPPNQRSKPRARVEKILSDAL